MSRISKADAHKIALALGAEYLGTVSARGGYFGAMQLVSEVQARFKVPDGGGRATDPHWTERRLVPLAPKTLTRLTRLSRKLHKEQGIVIAPLQLAGLLLERAAEQTVERAAEHVVGSRRRARMG